MHIKIYEIPWKKDLYTELSTLSTAFAVVYNKNYGKKEENTFCAKWRKTSSF